MNQKKFPEIEIKLKPKTDDLVQTPSRGIEYAFLSANNNQVNDFAYCRDYLQDIVYANVKNRDFSMYGLKYTPKEDNRISLDKCQILTRYKSRYEQFKKELGYYIENNILPFIHGIEELLRIPLTKVYQCKAQGVKYDIYLFEGHKRWIQAPPMVSLYALLIRIGLTYDGKVSAQEFIQRLANPESKSSAFPASQDKNILRNSRTILSILLRPYGDLSLFYHDIEKNYAHIKAISTMHNCLGLASFASYTYLKSKFSKSFCLIQRTLKEKDNKKQKVQIEG